MVEAGVEGDVVGGDRSPYPVAEGKEVRLFAFGCKLCRCFVKDCKDSGRDNIFVGELSKENHFS